MDVSDYQKQQTDWEENGVANSLMHVNRLRLDAIHTPKEYETSY